MYADVMTDSMMRAIGETNRRRALQQAYNEANGITPETVRNGIRDVLEITRQVEAEAPGALSEDERAALMRQVEDQMLTAAKELEFEKAAKLRDQLLALRGEKVAASNVQQKRHRMRRKRSWEPAGSEAVAGDALT
jgi:excinuclease ABC subunit B